MKYRHFDNASREYIITHPDTPLPWSVTNPKRTSKGVEKVIVNGKQVEGNVIRAEAGSSEVNVEVVMG